MGIETMGKVLVTAKVENLSDLYMVNRGFLSADNVRHVEVSDALVDTGATFLSMPKRLIDQLGLEPVRTRKVADECWQCGSPDAQRRSADDSGRDCLSDVTELPDDCPVLIGQLPLESLDFVIDLAGRRLIGNPEHGGEHIIELY